MVNQCICRERDGDSDSKVNVVKLINLSEGYKGIYINQTAL